MNIAYNRISSDQLEEPGHHFWRQDRKKIIQTNKTVCVWQIILLLPNRRCRSCLKAVLVITSWSCKRRAMFSTPFTVFSESKITLLWFNEKEFGEVSICKQILFENVQVCVWKRSGYSLRRIHFYTKTKRKSAFRYITMNERKVKFALYFMANTSQNNKDCLMRFLNCQLHICITL